VSRVHGECRIGGGQCGVDRWADGIGGEGAAEKEEVKTLQRSRFLDSFSPLARLQTARNDELHIRSME
jgi:hypothetical protein